MTAELLVGVSVLVVAVGLGVAVAVYRRRRFIDVFRQDSERLLRAAQIFVVGGLIVAFVILMIINNGWLE